MAVSNTGTKNLLVSFVVFVMSSNILNNTKGSLIVDINHFVVPLTD